MKAETLFDIIIIICIDIVHLCCGDWRYHLIYRTSEGRHMNGERKMKSRYFDSKKCPVPILLWKFTCEVSLSKQKCLHSVWLQRQFFPLASLVDSFHFRLFSWIFPHSWCFCFDILIDCLLHNMLLYLIIWSDYMFGRCVAFKLH